MDTKQPDTAAAPQAAATPASEPQPQPNPDLEAARTELQRLKQSEGRLRNEVGVLRRQQQEYLAMQNATEPQPAGDATATGTAAYAPQPAFTPFQAPPDAVSRGEFDLWRFEQENRERADFLKEVRNVAQDSNRVGDFIHYRVDQWGRPVIGYDGRAVPDVYRTYRSIATHLEAEALRKTQAAPAKTPANVNPALATISGNAAASQEDIIDFDSMSPDKAREEMIKRGLLESDPNDPIKAHRKVNIPMGW